MKHFQFTLIVVAILLAIALPAYGQDTDTPESRRAAAERYLAAMPLDEIVNGTIRTIALQMPKGQREEFARLMHEIIRTDQVHRVSLDFLVERFTTMELDAMANFYGSPEGRSIAKKFGAYMADLQPYMQAEFARALKELERRARSR